MHAEGALGVLRALRALNSASPASLQEGVCLGSHACVSHPVIHGCSLGGHRAQWQRSLLLGYVPGYGGAALEGPFGVKVLMPYISPSRATPLWDQTEKAAIMSTGDGVNRAMNSTGEETCLLELH